MPRQNYIINQERREAHCMVCHKEVEEGSFHPECADKEVLHCNPECNPIWEQMYFNGFSYNIEIELEELPSFFNRSIGEILARPMEIPNDFFESDNRNKRTKIKKVNVKTFDELYKEMKDSLLVNLYPESNKKEKGKIIDTILKLYIMEYEEKMLREIMDKTSGLRTYYDIRCFISDYMIRNR